MRSSLPREMLVVTTSDALFCELPSWQAGQSCRATQFGLIGATLLWSGLIFTIPVIATWAQGQAMDPFVMRWLVAFIGPTSIAGTTLLIYALRGAAMRTGIELTADRIGVIWRVGPLHLSRRIAWADIARLAVMPAWNLPVYANIEGSFLLQVVLVRGGSIQLAGDSDRVRMLALAGELARRAKVLRAASAEALMIPLPHSSLEVVEEDSRDVVADRDGQPGGSTAIVEQHADGLTITIPALRLRRFVREPPFYFILGVLAMLTVWIAASSAPAVAREGLVGLFTSAGSILPWLCTLFVMTVLVHVLSRRAQISARGRVLAVRWTNLLVTRRRMWHSEELAEVRVVSERVSSDTGKEWRQYLDIRSTDLSASASLHLLQWREKAELEWIATTLRRSLRLPAKQPGPNAATERWDDEIA
jgi:hypothetical protein